MLKIRTLNLINFGKSKYPFENKVNSNLMTNLNLIV